jgi:chromosome segregation ATPase
MLFNASFAHISGEIDKIYKELTMTESLPIGGTAYLTLENSEVRHATFVVFGDRLSYGD